MANNNNAKEERSALDGVVFKYNLDRCVCTEFLGTCH